MCRHNEIINFSSLVVDSEVVAVTKMIDESAGHPRSHIDSANQSRDSSLSYEKIANVLGLRSTLSNAPPHLK